MKSKDRFDSFVSLCRVLREAEPLVSCEPEWKGRVMKKVRHSVREEAALPGAVWLMWSLSLSGILLAFVLQGYAEYSSLGIHSEMSQVAETDPLSYYWYL